MTNSSSGSFGMHCIATPNAGIGEHTTGTTMYGKWSVELDSVRRQILLKKEHICALSKQFDNITCSRKKAKGELIRLVSTHSEIDDLRQLSHLRGFIGTGKRYPGKYEEFDREFTFPKRKSNCQCCQQRGDYQYQQCQTFQNLRHS